MSAGKLFQRAGPAAGNALAVAPTVEKVREDGLMMKNGVMIDYAGRTAE